MVALEYGRMHSVEVLARDERADLALLRITDADGETFPALPLADANTLAPGAPVVAIGRPSPASTYVVAGALAVAIVHAEDPQARVEMAFLHVQIRHVAAADEGDPRHREPGSREEEGIGSASGPIQ